MRITYTPVSNGGTLGTPHTYTLLGDKWLYANLPHS